MSNRPDNSCTKDKETMLSVCGLTVRYGKMTIVNDVSFSVKPGQWLMIVGPNGAGKSTIVNAVSQGVPYTGTVLFEGTDIAGCKPSEIARNIGVLSQNHNVSYRILYFTFFITPCIATHIFTYLTIQQTFLH